MLNITSLTVYSTKTLKGFSSTRSLSYTWPVSATDEVQTILTKYQRDKCILTKTNIALEYSIISFQHYEHLAQTAKAHILLHRNKGFNTHNSRQQNGDKLIVFQFIIIIEKQNDSTNHSLQNQLQSQLHIKEIDQPPPQQM